MNVNTFRP